MKKLIRSLFGLIAFAISAAIAAAMNNADVIKMVKAELDDDTIILAINAAKDPKFDTSADGLVELKNKGVSQTVIQAVVKKQNGGQVASAPATSSSESRRVVSNEVGDDEVLPPEIEPVAGQQYFTRYTFKYEDKDWPITNYARGQTVPINTPVTLVSIGKNSFTIKFVDSGTLLKIDNIEKHSKRSTEQIAKEFLSEKPTAIEKYGKEMADHISTGTLRLGMTKTQVLLTRGYPPSHETPTLEGDLWKYWSSRFVVHSLAFENDILVNARGVD